MNPDITAEDRVKMQVIASALGSGNVHPTASAYMAGLDKATTLISGIKDDAGVEAARPQLAVIYAQMAGPAAQLKAMSENDRQVAFGSAYVQLTGFGMKMAGIMIPLASKPELADKVNDLLNGMPQPD